MQCNQPFYGNGFPNGPFGSSFNTPIHSNQGMYPEIVGEGQVTSVTLPDGSVQFFFMPTLKWWSQPNANQCQPFQSIPNPMFANNNYSIPPPYNNNGGTWFIRSIFNPFPQSACNSPSQRNEFPRLAINDCNHNFNSHDIGYQVKFHHDVGTSTTDLVYFYPGLRQRDFVLMPPYKDKAVQVDAGPVTNNTVCHYQVVCSKPCKCSIPCVKPMSLETLVEPNLTPKSNKSCSCCVGAKPMNLETPVDPNLSHNTNNLCNCSADAKPISLETPVGPTVIPKSNKPVSFSAGAKPMSLECLVDHKPTPKSNNTSTEEVSYSKEYNKRGKDKKKKRNKKKNIICGCDSTPTTNIVNVDKSITTYADEGVGCNPADGCETQTCRTEESQCDVDAEPMNKPLPTTKWCCCSDSSTCDESSCDDISDKKHTQRGKSGKYKRSKPYKCDCGCCDGDSSVDCDSASEIETVGNKDKGEETPFTCSTCSIKTVLGNSKGSPIKIAKRASIGKVNSSLQWLTSDMVFQKRDVKEVKIAIPSVSPSSETEKYSENLLDHTCIECDTATRTCGEGNE